MTTNVIKLSLSVPALRSLIKDDAALEMELKSSVLKMAVTSAAVFGGDKALREIAREANAAAEAAARKYLAEKVGTLSNGLNPKLTLAPNCCGRSS